MELDPNIASLMSAFPSIFKEEPPLIWSELPAGWVPLVSQLFEQLTTMLEPQELQAVQVAQIKEKLGALRIRLDFSRFEPERAALVRERINRATMRSSTTCQLCGDVGRLVRPVGGRMATLCAAHGPVSDT